MSSPDQCMATSACRFALAPLCALREAYPLAADGDSEALRHGARFAVCDIANTAGGSGRNREKTEDCTKKAGLRWGGRDGLKSCAQGPEAFGVMYSPDYANKVIAAMHRLRKQKWKEPPGMPWIFLNGELLRCEGDAASCSAWKTPRGDKKLQEKTSLLDLVCARLDPRPKACDEALARLARQEREEEGRGGGRQPEEEHAPACESCVEVGMFHWQHHESARLPSLPAILAGAAALLFALAARVLLASRTPSPAKAGSPCGGCGTATLGGGGGQPRPAEADVTPPLLQQQSGLCCAREGE